MSDHISIEKAKTMYENAGSQIEEDSVNLTLDQYGYLLNDTVDLNRFFLKILYPSSFRIFSC